MFARLACRLYNSSYSLKKASAGVKCLTKIYKLIKLTSSILPEGSSLSQKFDLLQTADDVNSLHKKSFFFKKGFIVLVTYFQSLIIVNQPLAMYKY